VWLATGIDWDRVLAGISVWVGVLAAQASGAEIKPQAYDRQISKTVARLLVDEHLSKQR